jgi:DNA-binding CsgD family transcriptional regulator
VGTVDDAFALVLNSRYADALPGEKDAPAADRSVVNASAGGEPAGDEEGPEADSGDRPVSGATLLHPSFTVPENDVARWLVQGLGNKEIARKLYISPRTVETHVRNLRDKVGAANRVELATRLIQQRENP